MMDRKFGIVICSRVDSKRLANKPFIRIRGKFVIVHLIERLLKTGIPIVIAVPNEDYFIYKQNLNSLLYENKSLKIIRGNDKDPLARTARAAKMFGFTDIIRVTHDKIFLSKIQISHFINHYVDKDLDYIYSTNFIDGMSFEIFKKDLLLKCTKKYKKVEHISFALDAMTEKKLNMNDFYLSKTSETKYLRLLIDYATDISLLNVLFRKLGAHNDIETVIECYKNNRDIFKLNELPKLSVYTCAYNSQKYLFNCLESIASQNLVNFEIIIIDDCSRDSTPHIAKSFVDQNKYTSYIRNEFNLGLATSSNIALERCLGKYIMRLDSDDYFLTEDVLTNMLTVMENSGLDILYPDNQQPNRIQPGNEQHHVGGALFRRRALDYLKFTDGLRHYDGLDLYLRAKDNGIKIGYFNKPTFYYRQHEKSLSKSRSISRLKIKNKLDRGINGEGLLIND